MEPKFDLDKIRYSIDQGTYERAIELYQNQKVVDFVAGYGNFEAIVLSSHKYHIVISADDFAVGECDCYLGQHETLCKHMVAVAIFAILKGKKFPDKYTKPVGSAVCSGKVGTLSSQQLSELKQEIRVASRYIKSYNGPSKIWFQYQDSLTEGCRRLSEIVSRQPVSLAVAKIFIDLAIRLDKKLMIGGVDDSDGTVGEFIENLMLVLKDFEKIDPECRNAFCKLEGIETCFGWKAILLK